MHAQIQKISFEALFCSYQKSINTVSEELEEIVRQGDFNRRMNYRIALLK